MRKSPQFAPAIETAGHPGAISVTVSTLTISAIILPLAVEKGG
jgi:hypothetical protein